MYTYQALDEILPHNFSIEPRETDMLIKMIVRKELTDDIRLKVINEAVYHYGGTVVEALVEKLYNMTAS